MRTLGFYIHIADADIKNEATEMVGVYMCEHNHKPHDLTATFCTKCGSELKWKRVPRIKKAKIEGFPKDKFVGYISQGCCGGIIVTKRYDNGGIIFDSDDFFPIEISPRKIELDMDRYREENEQLIDELQEYFGCPVSVRYGIL